MRPRCRAQPMSDPQDSSQPHSPQPLRDMSLNTQHLAHSHQPDRQFQDNSIWGAKGQLLHPPREPRDVLDAENQQVTMEGFFNAAFTPFCPGE